MNYESGIMNYGRGKKLQIPFVMVFFGSILFVPFLANAYSPNPSPLPAPPPSITNTSDVGSFFCQGLNWAFYFLLIFAVLAVLIAAYKYLTSGGEPDAVSTANKMFLYAAVAVAVALMAQAIPLIVGSILNLSLGSAC